MHRTKSSILFLLILGLALALVVWWTLFQIQASGELAAAGRHLIAGDIAGAAVELGAVDAADLEHVARSRRTMFASEGLFFGLVLLASGWLYIASVRREASLRAAQDRFLTAATHELKTPLATIVLLLESLRDGRLPENKRHHYLQNGLSEAERLERGLTNVLTAAGLRTAPRAAQRLAGDLVHDVREAMAAVAARAQAADVALESELPPALPIARDPAAIQLVLRNVLDNAVKFSGAGSVVRVALAAESGQACIRIRDGGRGMDGDELANAFRPFWRGSDTVSGGTGLGLHLVRELVVAHGGSVTAHSAGRGKGSEFTIRLPLARTA